MKRKSDENRYRKEDCDMPVNTVIRTKRKELGLTQEQVAQRLGVSAPAVNKWESGSTYPDITILPALARLLETDLNTLLCFREELTEQEIVRDIEEVAGTVKEKGIEAGFELAERKMREYPNCMELIQGLTTCLEGSVILYGGKEMEYNLDKYRKKIVAYYEFVFRNAKEGRIKNSAAYMLVGKYVGREQYEQAEELINILPEREADKRILQANVLQCQGRLSEAAEILEGKIIGDVNEIHIALDRLMDITMDEGNEADAEKIADIGSRMAELFSLWGYNSILLPMELAVKKKDIRESVRYIREMLERCVAPTMTSSENTAEQSVLMRHISSRREEKNTGENAKGDAYADIAATVVRALQFSPEYEFLREDEEFQSLMEEYSRKYQDGETAGLSSE